MTDWHFKSATALTAAIRAGEVTSSGLLEHFIKRYEAHNGALNAIVATDFDAARTRARAADDALAKGENWGPLHGLPMTIKDALEVEGMPATGGAPQYADHRPAAHAAAVQKIVDAGAVIFGKTNVPFFSGDLQTYNDVYGTTNNPWDLARGPGGSSGGSAAALAGGLTSLELGSDIGGSIRTPAHLCGVFGHKPSYGIVSKRGHIPPVPGALMEGDLSVAGPLARSAGDLELLLKIVTGPGAMDAAGWRLDLPAPRARKPGELKAGVWFDEPMCDIDAESMNLLNKAADALGDAGAAIDRSARPDCSFAEMTEAYLVLLHSVVTVGMPAHVKQRWHQLKETLSPDDKSHKALQARGGTLTHAEWLVWHEKRQQIRAKWAAFFSQYDVMLTPVLMRPAFEHDHTSDWHKRVLTVNGVARPYMDVLLWAGPAVLAYLPASVVPVGVTSEGLPVGLQIIGPYLEDYTPIEVAKMVEGLLGGFKAPPGY